MFIILSKTPALGSESWKCSCGTNDFSEEALCEMSGAAPAERNSLG